MDSTAADGPAQSDSKDEWLEQDGRMRFLRGSASISAVYSGSSAASLGSDNVLVASCAGGRDALQIVALRDIAPLHEPSVAPSTVFPAFTDSLTGSDGAFANGVAVSTVVPISIPHTHEDQLEGSVLAAVPVAGSRGDNCSVYLFGEKRTGGAGMTLEGHTGPVLAATAAQNLLVTAGADNTVRAWRLTGHAEIQRPASPPPPPTLVEETVDQIAAAAPPQLAAASATAAATSATSPVTAAEAPRAPSPVGGTAAAARGKSPVQPAAKTAKPTGAKTSPPAVEGKTVEEKAPTPAEPVAALTPEEQRQKQEEAKLKEEAERKEREKAYPVLVSYSVSPAFAFDQQAAVTALAIAVPHAAIAASADEPSATAAVKPASATYVFSGDVTGRVRAWELNTGKCVAAWPAHAAGITSLWAAPNAAALLSAAADGSVSLWLLSEPKPEPPPTPPKFDPDMTEEERAAVQPKPRPPREPTLEHRLFCAVAPVGAPGNSVRAWSVHWPQRLLFCGCTDGTLRVLRLPSIPAPAPVEESAAAHEPSVAEEEAEGSEGEAETAEEESEPEPLPEAEVLRKTRVHYGPVRGLWADVERRVIVTGGHDGMLRVFEFDEEDTEAKHQAELARLNELPAEQYLVETVYPALSLALQNIDRDRPRNAAEVLAYRLLQFDKYLKTLP